MNNRYAAPCVKCATRIPAGEGTLSRDDSGAWIVTHPDACPAPAPVAATATAPAPMADPGYYVRGEDVFVVVPNRARTATYAKALIVRPTASGAMRGTWEYAPGIGRDLAREGLAPLTVEEAARLSRLHGVCVICGRALTDAKSVQQGIGPVCRKRLTVAA